MIKLSKKSTMRHGSVTVETAIFFIFMVFLTFAIVQFSLIVNAIITVQYIARESGRYACVHYKDSGFGDSNVQNFANTVVATSSSTVPQTMLYVETNGQKYPRYYGPGTTALDNNVVPNPNTITVEVKYDLTKKYLFFPYIPGLPKPWLYTYYYTTFQEGY